MMKVVQRLERRFICIERSLTAVTNLLEKLLKISDKKGLNVGEEDVTQLAELLAQPRKDKGKRAGDKTKTADLLVDPGKVLGQEKVLKRVQEVLYAKLSLECWKAILNVTTVYLSNKKNLPCYQRGKSTIPYTKAKAWRVYLEGSEAFSEFVNDISGLDEANLLQLYITICLRIRAGLCAEDEVESGTGDVHDLEEQTDCARALAGDGTGALELDAIKEIAYGPEHFLQGLKDERINARKAASKAPRTSIGEDEDSAFEDVGQDEDMLQ